MVRYTGSSSGGGVIATCFDIGREKIYTLKYKGRWEEQSEARR
jgi:hypothetical protein